jgi:dTDP-4-amino-4,6-dideoxygalactose transaminase
MSSRPSASRSYVSSCWVNMTDSPWRITLADVTIGEEERQAVDDVLSSGWLSMGPRTEQFEDALGQYLDARNVLAVTNGTAALHLAAAALGVGPGDEVIVPALTFVASAAGIRQTGASVVLADSTSLDDFGMPAREVDRLVTEQTKALVLLHYGGHPAAMDELLDVAKRHQLYVIEDAAHALGATFNGASCGTLGDGGCFSFFPNKNMTTGEGGALVFRNPDHAERARRLRSHAMTTLTWDRHRGHASTYDVTELGFNYRIDEIRAALGIAQLQKLPRMNELRGQRVARYRERLGRSTRVSVPSQGGRGSPAWHLATLVAESEESRDAIREALRIERIQTSLHYPAISGFTAYTESKSSVPVAEQIAGTAATLPLHPNLSLDEVDVVADLILRATGEA